GASKKGDEVDFHFLHVKAHSRSATVSEGPGHLLEIGDGGRCDRKIEIGGPAAFRAVRLRGGNIVACMGSEEHGLPVAVEDGSDGGFRQGVHRVGHCRSSFSSMPASRVLSSGEASSSPQIRSVWPNWVRFIDSGSQNLSRSVTDPSGAGRSRAARMSSVHGGGP